MQQTKQSPWQQKFGSAVPMAIKEDTHATFRPSSASNLLIVGQQDEITTGMIGSSLESLQAQYNKQDANVHAP